MLGMEKKKKRRYTEKGEISQVSLEEIQHPSSILQAGSNEKKVKQIVADEDFESPYVAVLWSRVQTAALMVTIKHPTSVLCSNAIKYLQTWWKKSVSEDSTCVMFSLIKVNTILEQNWKKIQKRGGNLKRRCQPPDWSRHIWGNQRAVVRVSKQYRPSSLLTWHNRTSGGGFLMLLLQGGGAVFCLGWLCSGADERLNPPSDCHDSAVMSESVCT